MTYINLKQNQCCAKPWYTYQNCNH